jgi:hypothetical protein
VSCERVGPRSGRAAGSGASGPPCRGTNGHVSELTDEARPYTLSFCAAEKRNADRDTRELNKVRPRQRMNRADGLGDINTSRWHLAARIEIWVRRDQGARHSQPGDRTPGESTTTSAKPSAQNGLSASAATSSGGSSVRLSERERTRVRCARTGSPGRRGSRPSL